MSSPYLVEKVFICRILDISLVLSDFVSFLGVANPNVSKSNCPFWILPI